MKNKRYLGLIAIAVIVLSLVLWFVLNVEEGFDIGAPDTISCASFHIEEEYEDEFGFTQMREWSDICADDLFGFWVESRDEVSCQWISEVFEPDCDNLELGLDDSAELCEDELFADFICIEDDNEMAYVGCICDDEPVPCKEVCEDGGFDYGYTVPDSETCEELSGTWYGDCCCYTSGPSTYCGDAAYPECVGWCSNDELICTPHTLELFAPFVQTIGMGGFIPDYELDSCICTQPEGEAAPGCDGLYGGEGAEECWAGACSDYGDLPALCLVEESYCDCFAGWPYFCSCTEGEAAMLVSMFMDRWYDYALESDPTCRADVHTLTLLSECEWYWAASYECDRLGTYSLEGVIENCIITEPAAIY